MKFSIRDLLLVTVIVALAGNSPRATLGQGEAPKIPDIKVELPAGVLEPDASLIEHLATHSEDKICHALLKQLGVNPDKSKDRFTSLLCKLKQSYKTASGEARYVFVYDTNGRGWPGFQPQTIVIADGKFRPLIWKEVGGSPMMEKVAFAADNPVVSITCAHRHTFTHSRSGTYRYSLHGDEIRTLGEPVWIYPPSGAARGLLDGLCHRWQR